MSTVCSAMDIEAQIFALLVFHKYHILNAKDPNRGPGSRSSTSYSDSESAVLDSIVELISVDLLQSPEALQRVSDQILKTINPDCTIDSSQSLNLVNDLQKYVSQHSKRHSSNRR